MNPALKRVGRTGRRIYLLVSAGLLAAALATELRRPAGQRTWQGHVAGVVPYNFRPPDRTALRSGIWQPECEQLLIPRSFGVGWSVNIAEVVRRARTRSLSGKPHRSPR